MTGERNEGNGGTGNVALLADEDVDGEACPLFGKEMEVESNKRIVEKLEDFVNDEEVDDEYWEGTKVETFDDKL